MEETKIIDSVKSTDWTNKSLIALCISGLIYIAGRLIAQEGNSSNSNEK